MSRKGKAQARSFINTILITIIVCSLLYLLVMRVLHMVVVTGRSMQPTYEDGDVLLCSTDYTKESLDKGDVVVFTYQKKPCVKRIIGVPGDTVTVANGQFVVNGTPQVLGVDAEPFVAMEDPGILSGGFSITLGADEFFCAGDNRNNSTDCREFGQIDYDEINLQVIKKLF